MRTSTQANKHQANKHSGSMSLIDKWLPEYGANEVHQLRVAAPAADAYHAVLHANLVRGNTVRALMILRGLPEALRSGRPFQELRQRAVASVTVHSLETGGFRVLEEDPPQEVVIGLEGRFWTPTGGVSHHDVAHYSNEIPAGVVRAVWNFRVEKAEPRSSVVSTETRIAWTDQAAGRSFMRYWRIIKPWSGLIRRHMLHSIRAAAEERVTVGNGRNGG